MKIRVLACVIAMAPGLAVGWQIEPIVTPTDQKLVRRAGIIEWIQLRFGTIADRVVGDPLHEAIILRAEGCDHDNPADCFEQRSAISPGHEPLFGGVQWNDNPPFVLDKGGFKYASGKDAPARCLGDTIRLPRLPDCWMAAMRDAEGVAERFQIDAAFPILYRSHYGDLQFLHGMATGKEPASTTKAKMMLWAEFAFKVARGDIPSTTSLDKVAIPGFPALIGIRERTVESLFTLGDPVFRGESQIGLFALGTLLHMVQDTFSDAHAERGDEGGLCEGESALRQPGAIRRFHSYDMQDPDKHKNADTRQAFHNHDLKIGNNAVQVTKNLLKFHRDHAEWPPVQAYLECVFRIATGSEDLPPDSGEKYRK